MTHEMKCSCCQDYDIDHIVTDHRVVISDGVYFMQGKVMWLCITSYNYILNSVEIAAMLASQHTPLVENETLQKYSLLVLKDYVCNSLQNRK